MYSKLQEHIENYFKSYNFEEIIHMDLDLGELIKSLKLVKADTPVFAYVQPEESLQTFKLEYETYRGDYSESAISPSTGAPVTAGELLELLVSQLGKELYGYKGGEYLQTESIYLFYADPGRWSQLRLVAPSKFELDGQTGVVIVVMEDED